MRNMFIWIGWDSYLGKQKAERVRNKGYSLLGEGGSGPSVLTDDTFSHLIPFCPLLGSQLSFLGDVCDRGFLKREKEIIQATLWRWIMSIRKCNFKRFILIKSSCLIFFCLMKLLYLYIYIYIFFFFLNNCFWKLLSPLWVGGGGLP